MINDPTRGNNNNTSASVWRVGKTVSGNHTYTALGQIFYHDPQATVMSHSKVMIATPARSIVICRLVVLLYSLFATGSQGLESTSTVFSRVTGQSTESTSDTSEVTRKPDSNNGLPFWPYDDWNPFDELDNLPPVEEKQRIKGWGLEQQHLVGAAIYLDNRLVRKSIDIRRKNEEIVEKLIVSTEGIDEARKFNTYGEFLNKTGVYQGSPVDAFVFIIIPLMLGTVFSIVLQAYRPTWKNKNLSETVLPIIPLIYFQQSKEEASVPRDNKKTIREMSKYFTICSDDDIIDIRQMQAVADVRQVLIQSPWDLIKFMVRLHALYKKE